MKVSYGGRVRKFNSTPGNMSEFKEMVQQRFINCHVQGPDLQNASQMSRILDDSELNGDNSEFASMIN